MLYNDSTISSVCEALMPTAHASLQFVQVSQSRKGWWTCKRLLDDTSSQLPCFSRTSDIHEAQKSVKHHSNDLVPTSWEVVILVTKKQRRIRSRCSIPTYSTSIVTTDAKFNRDARDSNKLEQKWSFRCTYPSTSIYLHMSTQGVAS